MPSGRGEKHQQQARKKLCSWIIKRVSMTMTISGKSTKIDALPLADFLKRAAGLDPVGRLEMVADFLQFWPDLVGGRQAPARRRRRRFRTVIAMSRFAPPQGSAPRGEYSIFCDLLQRYDDAVCAEVMVRSPNAARGRGRSDGTARGRPRRLSRCRRGWSSPGAPEISMASACETSCGVRPRRAGRGPDQPRAWR